MLYRKLLMVGASSTALSSHWVLPGGHIITLNEDGSLDFANPEDGWPMPVGSGDPFVDSQRRVGTYELLSYGGGIGEARSVRLRDTGSDREAVRSLGPYRGFASENLAIGMISPGTDSNPFEYSRPSWFMSCVSGGYHETGNTTDWPWEQQSKGTVAGESTLSPDVQVIQANYTPRMAYPWGVCVARNLAVITRLEATAITGAPDGSGPGGRPWIGWTMDAAGVARRIADLSPAQARQLGHGAGFVPDAGEIISSSGQNHSWQFIRPLGPVGANAVLATGCLKYEETYTRIPTPAERPYFMKGRNGTGTNHISEILPNVAWFNGESPITITERRSTYLFCIMTIQAGGITSITVTGSSSARSSDVVAAKSDRAFSTQLDFKLYRRRDGGYDVIWENWSQYDRFNYRGTVVASEYVYSPNGWKTPIIWPTIDGQIATGYMPVWFTPESATLGSTPPTKPADWDDATQGPWVRPPYDVDESFAWKGMRYWWPNEQQWHWQQNQNSAGADYGRFGQNITFHPLAPNGPYPRNGARQWYGSGEFAVARHQDQSFSSHLAGLIVPGIATGPGGALQPYAASDGLNPVMRDLRWPGREYRMAMTQDGQWSFSSGQGWTPMASFGTVEGTICVGARLEDPDPVS